MKVRICPICDQEMRHKHFCTNCRCFVKEPIEREKYKPVSRVEVTSSTYEYKPVKTENVKQKKGYAKVKEKKTSFKTAIGVIALLFSILTAVAGILPDIFYDGKAGEIIGSIFQPAEDDFENMYEELTEEEVMSAAEACTGRNHMKYLAKEMFDILELQVFPEIPFLSDYITEESGDNYVWYYEDGDVTYYQHEKTYYFDEEYKNKITVDYDTATGELHCLALRMENRDTEIQAMLSILEIFTGEEKEQLKEVFEEELGLVEEGKDYIFWRYGGYEVYYSFPEETGYDYMEIASYQE